MNPDILLATDVRSFMSLLEEFGSENAHQGTWILLDKQDLKNQTPPTATLGIKRKVSRKESFAILFLTRTYHFPFLPALFFLHGGV